MKDFLVMCAKVALGLLIGFTLIFGGSTSFKGKSESIRNKANTELDKISFTSTSTSTP